MKKQTAVDWVLEYLWKNHHLSFSNSNLMKAKAMEKEQIIDAHLFGLIIPLEIDATKQAEQYYNETYNK